MGFVSLQSTLINHDPPLFLNQWLQGFAYRINIGPLVFIEAGMISLTVALLTMAWQSVKAAMSNPVNSLRSE